MGTYVTIGLATRIRADKKRVKRDFWNLDEFKTTLKQLFNSKDIYDVSEDDDSIILTLKEEVARQEWIDFLRTFYQLRFGENCDLDGQTNEQILKALSAHSNLQSWLDIAKEKKFYCYQSDHIGYYPIRGGSHYSYLSIDYVLLDMAGKAIMECYAEMFLFFTQLLRERLSSFRLSDTLFVAMTE